MFLENSIFGNCCFVLFKNLFFKKIKWCEWKGIEFVIEEKCVVFFFVSFIFGFGKFFI